MYGFPLYSLLPLPRTDDVSERESGATMLRPSTTVGDSLLCLPPPPPHSDDISELEDLIGPNFSYPAPVYPDYVLDGRAGVA